MPKCDFNKVAKNCFSVSLLHIFRTPFPKKTSKGLLLHVYNKLLLYPHCIGSTNFKWPVRIISRISLQSSFVLV